MKAFILFLFILAEISVIKAQCKIKIDDMTKTKIVESKHADVGSERPCGFCMKLFLKMSVTKINDFYSFERKIEGKLAKAFFVYL